MEFPVSAAHVWWLLLGLAVFSAYWAAERSLYFLFQTFSLVGFLRRRGTRTFEHILQSAGSDLAEAHRLATFSGWPDLRIRLLRKSRAEADRLKDQAERASAAADRFSTFESEALPLGTSLGFLGTILGMMEQFRLGNPAGGGPSEAIGMAMQTTALGLTIGLIVTYLFGTVFHKFRSTLRTDVDSVLGAFVGEDTATSQNGRAANSSAATS